MRLRLFLRRLTVSAPRMAVHSAFPWPLRWAVLALMLGFCAAIALWAFELGKDIAGVGGSKAALQQMQAELISLREELVLAQKERDTAQFTVNTAASLLTAEKVAQEKLALHNKQLDADNRRLREDLGFFEKLIPSSNAEGLAIRGLQVEVVEGRQLKWQVIVTQAIKNAPEFSGRLELALSGSQNGKPWVAGLPQGGQTFKQKQFGRIVGVLDLPAAVTVKTVTAKVLQGSVIKAAQSIKL